MLSATENGIGIRRSRSRCGLMAALICCSLLSVRGSDIAVTNTNDSGGGSLRQAILDANLMAGPDHISFVLPAGSTIRPLSALPALNDVSGGTDIDGDLDADGRPDIILDGSLAGEWTEALVIESGANRVHALVIGRFYRAIRIHAGALNTISSCYLGIDPDGSPGSDWGLGHDAVQIESGAADTCIGGVSPESRNVIGNAGSGIAVFGATGVTIEGNWIGVAGDGTAAAGNAWDGIHLYQVTDVDVRYNVSAANGGVGVIIHQSSQSVTVAGNLLGVGADGLTPLGNNGEGLLAVDAAAIMVGGITAGERNIVGDSKNWYGIKLWHVQDSQITGNYLGLGADGVSELGNHFDGLLIDGASVRIDVASNTVVGNDGTGIAVINSSAITITGNLVGLAGDGSTAAGNQADGIRVSGGADIAVSGNVIGANGTVGLRINGSCLGATVTGI